METGIAWRILRRLRGAGARLAPEMEARGTRVFRQWLGRRRQRAAGRLADSQGFGAMVEVVRAHKARLPSQRDAVGYLDLDLLARSFRRRNVRYVMCNVGYLGWCVENTRIRRDELAFSLYTLVGFLERHTRPVVRVGGVLLFQVVP